MVWPTSVNGIPSNIRLAIVSPRYDVCAASNSTWSDSDTFIESTSTPMAIAYRMGLAPVMIRLLLQRCSIPSDGTLSHNQLTALYCQ